MKIVGLVAFRDEAPYLPFCLTSLVPLVDHVVGLDDRSTDAGPDLLRDTGATIVAAPTGVAFGARRAAMLEAGRAAGGTHFVVVDADEVFSEPFSREGRATIEKLTSGTALAFPFRTLWKGWSSYRVGREYDMPLTTVFADDGVSTHPPVAIHEGRVPAPALASARHVPPDVGEMFHLQFTAWHRSQIKQAWYRGKEFRDGASPLRVNARYLTTLDGPHVRTRPVAAGAMSHLPDLQALVDLPPSWHLDELMAWMDADGVARYERLQIWHVPELRARFEAEEGRPPRSARYTPPIARLTGDIFGAVRARVRRVRSLAPHRG